MPFSPMTNDRVFRFVFGEPEGLPVLKSLINAYFDLAKLPPVVELELLNPDLGPEAFGEKRTALDILAQDETGRKINIEIQTSRKPAFVERSLFYWARLYGRQLPEGENYLRLRPVVTINFLEYEVDPSGPAICEYRLPLTDHLVMFQVELPKFVGKPAELLNTAEIWGKFLEEPESGQLEPGTPVHRDLEAARHRMEDFMSLTPDVVREIQLSMYDHDIATLKKMAELEGLAQGEARGMALGEARGMALGEARGEARGLERGRAEKIQETLDEVTRRLRAAGVPDDAIQKVVEGL